MKSVFISSTFKDMQSERDYFHEKVFPRIQRAIAPLGENIQELDLRWGVDTSNMTEEESGKQVIKVCIDAIDRCKPYTVVLLGERYGWIPGLSVVRETQDSRVDVHYKENMSITNLEIRYAALDNEELVKRCIFCFRNPSVLEKMDEADRSLYAAESPMHQERLEELKKEIRRIPQAKIVEYEVDWDRENHKVTGVETLGEQVYELLLQMLQSELQGQIPRNPEEQIDLETNLLMERYLASYIQRGQEEHAILNQAFNYQFDSRMSYLKKQCKDIFLCGEAGSGKSALMASCAHRLMENGERVILYFCGAPGCQSVQMLERMIVYKLERFLGLPAGSTKGSMQERLEDLNERLRGQQVFCFLDGLDQLFPQGAELYLNVLGVCSQIYFVLSALPEFPMEELLRKAARSCTRVELGGLNPFQARKLIAATTRRRGKKLDDELVDAIIAKKGAHNPLYLSLILQRFFMMDGREFRHAEALSPGMEGLHLYMEGLLSQMPEEPEDLIQSILLETGARFGEGEFEEILTLLAASKNGLSESELEDILKLEDRSFSQLRFQQIVSYLYDAFDLSGYGKWEFSHRLFREALMRRSGALKARQLLARYALMDREFLEREGFVYVLEERLPEGVRVLEVARQFADTGALYDCVARLLQEGEEEYFSAMLDVETSKELRNFWLTDFPGKRYGKTCQVIQGRFIQKLLEKGGCSSRQQASGWKYLAEEAIDSGSFSEAETMLERGERAAVTLVDPERSLLLAQFQFYRGTLAIRQEEFGEGLSCMEKARAFMEADFLYQEEAFFKEAVFWRIRSACACIVENVWQKKEFRTQELDKECEFLEEKRPQLSERFYATPRLRLLVCRTLLIRRSDLPNEKKREVAEPALNEAKELANRYSSLDNLHLLRDIMDNIRSFEEKDRKYRIAMEVVGCARRCLELGGTDTDAQRLMDALFSYADAADQILTGNPKQEIIDEIGKTSAACWEEGFAIMDDLQHSGYLQMDSYEMAYLHCIYCERRIELDIDEAAYPDFIKHAKEVVRLYEEIKEQIRPEDLSGWFIRVRNAHQILGRIYQKLHENEKAVSHFQASLKFAKEICQMKLTSSRILKQFEIQENLMYALYKARRDEEALKEADELEQLLIEYQVTGGEDMWFKICYVRGRIAFERGDLVAAHNEVKKIEGKYEKLFTGKLLGDSYFLLKLDVALEEGNLTEAEKAWNQAKNHLMNLGRNKFMREHMPCMMELVRYYLEYGYKKYIKLRSLSGNPISEKEQNDWLVALNKPPIDRLAVIQAEHDAFDREKRPEEEKARDSWRKEWTDKWENFSTVLDEGSMDTLLMYQELYGKFIAEDPVYTLPYELRTKRQALARELYQRTKDPEYIRSYLTETNKLASETSDGYTSFHGSSTHIYDLDPSIHIFDREKEWDRLACELLWSLYEETGEKLWLIYTITYLDLTKKRRNLSRISWYDEIFAYIEARLPEEAEYLAELREWRYERELDRMMLSYRISRVKLN